ncbi:MAG: TIGR04551 family protein [Polyangiaceae bacterium]|nr:TIGR04551 family protein [Polyangiaceae bacterium]
MRRHWKLLAPLALGALVPVAVSRAAWAQPAPAQPAPTNPPPAAQPAPTGQPPTPGDEPPLLPPDAPPTDKPPVDQPPPKPAPPPETKTAPTATAGKTVAADTKAAAPKKNANGDATESDTQVFAEDWWTSARPVFEIHGYYRVRSEFFSHFALGRVDLPADTLWPQPPDNSWTDINGNSHPVKLCGDDPLKPENCENNVQAGANMRFRINPELHISDNIRVMAQIDMLDNVVLGSTPEGYSNQPSGEGGYDVRQPGGYTPIGAFSSTQWAPSAGQNSLQDSIVVKRVWGEYMTPIGQLRFGRMPSHWGLGMFINSGDGYDSDYGSTADRIMFSTGIKSWDLYFAGLWDFANEGPTSALIGDRQGQAYDLAQSDDVGQWGLVVVRRRNPKDTKLELAKGLPVVNGGVYAVYRQQSLEGQGALGMTASQYGDTLLRREAWAVIPDGWFQFLWGKFRFEAEATLVWGGIENTNILYPEGGNQNENNNFNNPDGGDDGWKIRQFGFAAQSEFRAFEDKLRIQLGGGYATGDDDVEGLAPPAEGFDAQLTSNRTFSTFRFHPDYRIDLILFRNILQRVQGVYYLRPSVEYDFTRDLDGQRIGGGAALIWSRASQFVQAPGNSPDLGLELNFKLYYQAKDGSLNDDLDKLGGFYTQLEYGVMFPLGGLGYLTDQEQEAEDINNPIDLSTAQTVRWYLGILY